MKNPITPIENTTDLKVRIFRVLGFGGFFVSALVVATNLIIGLPLQNTLICWATALLSLTLILYANRTGRYRVCVNITIVFIFLGVFTLLFLEGGGYKSGMPLYFIMAVVFTALPGDVCFYRPEALLVQRPVLLCLLSPGIHPGA